MDKVCITFCPNHVLTRICKISHIQKVKLQFVSTFSTENLRSLLDGTLSCLARIAKMQEFSKPVHNASVEIFGVSLN